MATTTTTTTTEAPPLPPPPPSITSQQQEEAERQLKLNSLKAKQKLQSHVVPPSHILSDGKFVYLPPPSDDDYANFFERSVAKFALISADVGTADDEDSSMPEDEKQKKRKIKGATKEKTDKEEDDQQPKIHPLALASARIQGNGISELSKAINLSSLVGQNEYFGLCNIVTASAELEAATAAADKKDGKETSEKKEEVVKKDEKGEGLLVDEEKNAIVEEQRLRASYITRSKRKQFTNASTVLHRHAKRLNASIVSQRIVDKRLLSLRKKWRLVAPEHGTRTVGPTRPTEVVAIDVEVYNRDRMGGGSAAVAGGGSSLGRIARMVPRYATIELGEGYNVKDDMKVLWKSSSHKTKRKHEAMEGGSSTSTATRDEKKAKKEDSNNETRAEPFAVADPTLGKVDENFDPDKVPMLTLLLQIEKSSSGYVKSVTLSSSAVLSSSSKDNEEKKEDGTDSSSSSKEDDKSKMQADERVVLALQHSLFCASLFESIRKEISSSEQKQKELQQKNQRSLLQHQNQHNSIVWLSSEMEDTFLPPPSLMAGGGSDDDRGGNSVASVGGEEYEDDEDDIGIASLCVVHCHEGEVKVQLDSEYALTIKLVEAGTASAAAAETEKDVHASSSSNIDESSSTSGDSGSQSPERLGVLCRALLLRAQFVYHEHCMKTRAGLTKAATTTTTNVGSRKSSAVPVVRSPRILQSCVGLGSKMLLERKVRSTLKHLSLWLQNDLKTQDKLQVEWVPYTLFDSHSQFALSVGNKFCMDVTIDGDGLHITTLGGSSDEGGGEYKSVSFGSAMEFELFMKFEMKRRLLLEQSLG